MSDRPGVSPLLLAEVFEQLPARLRRRLEDEPQLASAWTWNESRVEAAADAVVSLKASVITSMAQVSCTCLLAPKCLHIAAVLRALPLAMEENAAPAAAQEPSIAPDGEVLLDAKQREAARQMWSAAARVLSDGASAAGLVTEGELLRAIHSCRIVGLHRLSAAGLRTVERIRSLRAERPEFRLGVLTADIEELLLVARRLAVERADPTWIGTARREYLTVGSLKLTGLFTEPVIAASGYAGVVFEEQNLSLWLGKTLLYEAGIPRGFDAAAASDYLKNNREVSLRLKFNLGSGRCTFWTCDLSYDYVKLNSEYTT